MEKKFGAFSSSNNPQEFSKTLEGILKVLGYIGAYFATSQGIDLAITDINVEATVQAFNLLITCGMAIHQLGEVVFGFVRKFTVSK